MRSVLLDMLDPQHPRRVVIVGGGYAGITLAVTLANRMKPAEGLEIVLVTPQPFQQALTELDLVAAGTPRPQWAELWHGAIFRDLPVNVVYDRLDSVDVAGQTITVGPRHEPTGVLRYWRLVLATGAVPYVPDIPGLREHAVTLWSVPDALELQNRLNECARDAAERITAEERQRALSTVVVGGGATGIEVVGTIAAVLPPLLEQSGYDPGDLRTTLLDMRPEILYDLHESQRRKAAKRLEDMGVELVLGDGLAAVENGVVRTTSGREIPASVLVWCGGARADPDAATWGLALDSGGRLVTEPTLKAAGHQDIYVAGDIAGFPDPDGHGVLPMLAQYAIREAEHVADNILREMRGEALQPFTPHMHGEFVSVGPKWGVGWIGGLRLSGRIAIGLKRLTYVMYWLQVGSYRLAWRRFRQMLQMHRGM
jgi:NADH:quinone reductase (non-electrogenic)